MNSGAAITDVALDWQPVAGAVRYQLQVALDPDFNQASIKEDREVVSTRFSPQVTYHNDDFYWRVRPIDAGNNKMAWPPTPFQFNARLAEQADPAVPAELDQRRRPLLLPVDAGPLGHADTSSTSAPTPASHPGPSRPASPLRPHSCRQRTWRLRRAHRERPLLARARARRPERASRASTPPSAPSTTTPDIVTQISPGGRSERSRYRRSTGTLPVTPRSTASATGTPRVLTQSTAVRHLRAELHARPACCPRHLPLDRPVR